MVALSRFRLRAIRPKTSATAEDSSVVHAMVIVRTSVALTAALGACLANGQLAEPVHVRNLNPLVAVFGLPAWDTVPIGTRLGVTAEVANHYRFSVEDDELLMLDGETVRTNLALTHGFASGWSVGVEVPYYRVGGGVLDDLIDAWHSAFGLPDGGRNARPEGELLYRFGDRVTPAFAWRERQRGVGVALR